MTGYTCSKCQFSPGSLIPSQPATPLATLLLEGRSLCLKDKDAIRQSITEASRSIEELQKLVDSLECTVALCRGSLSAFEDFVADHKSALTVKRLPADVLKEIFGWVPFGQEKQDAIIFRSATPRSSPLALTHVSRKWREVAIRTPSLWTDVDLFVPAQYIAPSKMSLLNMWLMRSVAAPINVTFVVKDLAPNEPLSKTFGDAVLGILRMLSPHQDRWLTVNLQLPSIFYSMNPFPLNQTSRLVGADIGTSDKPPYKMSYPIFTQCCASLSLSIQKFRPLISESGPILPWKHVRSLATTKSPLRDRWLVDYDDVHDILIALSSLEELHVTASPLNQTNTGLIQHKTLRVLSLYSGSSSLLKKLDLPALQTLQINSIASEDDPLTLSNFISRSPDLSSLHIFYTDAQFLAGLTSESKISELVIITSPLYGFGDSAQLVQKAVAALAKFTSRSTTILPQLAGLWFILKFKKGEDTSPALIVLVQNALISFWRERGKGSKSQGCLANITLQLEGDLSEFTLGVVSHLREMAMEGFWVQTVLN